MTDTKVYTLREALHALLGPAEAESMLRGGDPWAAVRAAMAAAEAGGYASEASRQLKAWWDDRGSGLADTARGD